MTGDKAKLSQTYAPYNFSIKEIQEYESLIVKDHCQILYIRASTNLKRNKNIMKVV